MAQFMYGVCTMQVDADVARQAADKAAKKAAKAAIKSETAVETVGSEAAAK